jgi:hypothetical protein
LIGALVGERGAVVRVDEGLRALILEELRVLEHAASWRRLIWRRTAAGLHGARRGGVQRWPITKKKSHARWKLELRTIKDWTSYFPSFNFFLFFF